MLFSSEAGTGKVKMRLRNEDDLESFSCMKVVTSVLPSFQ